ncbi:hypothetical protein C6501_16970 [Candidatus Poribacteria bacterium]|nr:MAG: hypothetical protein C6501_16970 [Candidatus Poribacteria bacterium]
MNNWKEAFFRFLKVGPIYVFLTWGTWKYLFYLLLQDTSFGIAQFLILVIAPYFLIRYIHKGLKKQP